MGRIHGVIATTLALIAMIFYIIGMASSSTYEYDTGNIPGPPPTGPMQAYPTRLGPWSLCYRGAYENDCKVPTTKCEITYAAVPVNLKYTLPKCDNFNAYRAFIVIAFAFSVIGFLVMVYTTLRTGAWTAYYIGSTVVGISALMGLIAMAIAADYEKKLEDALSNNPLLGNVAVELRYGFALPLIAWIIQIPACIIFAWTPK